MTCTSENYVSTSETPWILKAFGGSWRSSSSRKNWSNKLQLRRKLFSKEGRVVHLLASLPDAYDMLVTALEAQSETVPKWELVTEILSYEELELKEKSLIRMR